ncbi:dihydroxyacetone kinase subunit DhaK [Pleomorphomonas koreensis]|uniref:dihydroxyacetone kinase subunit DhaK n=1 Tax=Pleomorphomonas koreensis TaxID=257440 RepID=UPI000417BEEC|nr:dihydroxyacetone kinase subunit DhaK [Pleomorphomonas koreensis]
MKKLINDVGAVVDDMIDGLVRSVDGLARIEGERVIVRRDLDAVRSSGQVALVSGGGSGHEPAHAGYVGAGMLTAAVCGDVFTSPSTDAVLSAIRAVGGPAGVLLIVKSYTGDRLNFGLAAEIARAEGIPVEMVIVADDVSLATGASNAGRRGIAGTVLVHKVAGAAAAAGLSLGEVAALARRVSAGVGSMGVGLTACTVPAAGRPSFSLADDEIEFGLGIHGEAGVRRDRLQPAGALVSTVAERIFDDRGLAAGDRVVLLVNNLGATPSMEMAIVAGEAARAAEARGLRVERMWTGAFLTALDMAGFSLSALAVDDPLLGHLDAPTTASAWPVSTAPVSVAPSVAMAARPDEALDSAGEPDPRLVPAIEAAARALIADEARLTALDQAVGDGDLGLNLARGAEAILAGIDDYRALGRPAALRRLSAVVRKTVGGTSGALYAVGLMRAAAVADQSAGEGVALWGEALAAAADAISRLGDARPGDRTMLDALLPAAEALAAAGDDPRAAHAAAVEAATHGAAATAAIASRRGRSSYLGDRAVGHPDPGAEAVVVWLAAIGKVLGEEGA